MCSLTPLSTTDPEYQNIISHFDLPPSSYVIHSILKITMEWIYTNRFDNAIMWAWKKPDTFQLFHGTGHACNVWELDNSNKLCDNIHCGNNSFIYLFFFSLKILTFFFSFLYFTFLFLTTWLLYEVFVEFLNLGIC
jgi:hypothetical protein